MAHALTIDTLAFSKSLKAAGADERLAEAIVEGLSKVDISDLATKADINELRGEIKGLDTKIDLLEKSLTIRLGGIMVAGIGALVLIDRLL